MLIQNNKGKGYKEANDLELCLLIQEGNEEAFSELFRRHYNALYQYGMSFHSDEELVKDSIQTLFLRLWRKREYVSDIESPKAYLLVSLRRIMLRDKEKKAARDDRNYKYVNCLSQEFQTTEQDIIDQERAAEQKEYLEAALNSLTKRQNEALLLRLHQGLDNDEIAYVMEVTKGRVEDLIYHATKRIKKEIENTVEHSLR